MALMFVICLPDEAPKLVKADKLGDPPDGCTGYMVIALPSGTPSLAVMPVNEMRPELENKYDFLTALSCANTYLKFDKLEGIEQVKQEQREHLMKMLTKHVETVMHLVTDQVTLEGTDPSIVTALLKAGFGIAHEKCCPDPVCRDDMHKRIHGARGEN